MTMACESPQQHHRRRGLGRPVNVRGLPAIERFSERRLLEMAGSGGTLSDILASICTLAEEAFSRCHCAIYLIDWPASTIRPGAAPSLPASFVAAICELPVQPDSAPCAKAALSRTQVIAADLAADPAGQFSQYGALASGYGLRSCWSTPIVSSTGLVLGTFAVLRAHPGRPTLLEQDLIARATLVARIAIERTQVTNSLRRCEACLAVTQRLSGTGSFVWQTARPEIAWSDELYRIFEVDAGETVTPELVGSRLHPADRAAMCVILDRARDEGCDVEYEHRLLMPDRSIKHLRVAARAIRDPDGGLEYVGAIQDVTRRHADEADLGKARSDLAQMMRIISLGPLSALIVHEVNQPLSGIIVNVSTGLRMLAADPADVAGAVEAMRRAMRDVRRTSDVVARLRTLFTAKEPRIAPVDLNEATQEVLGLLLSQFQRNRVSVRAELQAGLPPAVGDRVELQLVVVNLLLNASEAMTGIEDRPRLLEVRTERDAEDHVRLDVRDSGVGLDRRIVDRLFEPFYTTKRDGMGIGLFVSRFIMERHGGSLKAAPNDGPGATFSMSLPSAAHRLTA